MICFKFVLFTMVSLFYAPNKRANRSSLLFSLFVKDDFRSRCSFKKSEESDSLFVKRERALSFFCSQKMSDSQEKPTSEFPALGKREEKRIEKRREKSSKGQEKGRKGEDKEKKKKILRVK